MFYVAKKYNSIKFSCRFILFAERIIISDFFEVKRSSDIKWFLVKWAVGLISCAIMATASIPFADYFEKRWKTESKKERWKLMFVIFFIVMCLGGRLL